MAYNNWKMMDKVTVAVKTEPNYNGFTGYIVEAGDEEALNSAKNWATTRDYDREKREYVKTHEPGVYTFENKDFTAKILESAGGSSQGGRLSFWSAEVEKDGIKFTIGVNDAVLADLIRSSDISNGLVKQKVMFARKSGQVGLIHEGMKSYEDAMADTAHKKAMQSAKKTSKWEIGGVYSSITLTDICLGEVWDTMEEYDLDYNRGQSWSNWKRTGLRKRKTPVKVLAWTYLSKYRHENGVPATFTEFLTEELGDGSYVHFYTGKPPARAKTQQLEVTDKDLKIIDKLLKAKKDQTSYDQPEFKGRYVRELK